MARLLLKCVLIIGLIAVYSALIFQAGFLSGFEAGSSLIYYLVEPIK